MAFNFREEFPSYPADQMPAIPAEFMDTSWRNDMCPSFTSDKLKLHLWVDFPQMQDREHEGPRFILEEQENGIETGKLVVETENWDEVLAAIEALRQ